MRKRLVKTNVLTVKNTEIIIGIKEIAQLKTYFDSAIFRNEIPPPRNVQESKI